MAMNSEFMGMRIPDALVWKDIQTGCRGFETMTGQQHSVN